MKRSMITATAIGVALVAFNVTNAIAEQYNVTGVVKSVNPVFQTVSQQIPTQSCNTVDVPVYGNSGSQGSSVFGLDLEGAIIGGVIGNNVTKNVDNGGAAGAIIGGLIGSDMKKKKNQEITGYRQVNKCATEYNSRTEEYLAGYKIGYSALGLNGSVSSTRSRSVGDSISVNVNISAY